MLGAFFSLAMKAANRQRAFRWTAAIHTAALGLFCLAVQNSLNPEYQLILFGQFLLIIGIIEGATTIGWRLTQLPKSQALEFLLVSPLQPRVFFACEALVGVGRLLLVTLAGLPILLLMVIQGFLTPIDVLVLTALPFTWGMITGLGLTVWAYESTEVRRVGEVLSGLGILTYLIVGLLAGERLGAWLQTVPDPYGRWVFESVIVFRDYNPFGLILAWFTPGVVLDTPWERILLAEFVSALLLVGISVRAAFRLRGHFHDRHYKPIRTDRPTQTDLIGERPLSWWAVKRVLEYSGRSNLYLAGGFTILYSAYIVAGDRWPSWMGRNVFLVFERMGGPAGLITALVILAAVPAAFQYGLWDSSTQDRCRRLELLLLTDLGAGDYCHAAARAAWVRGRGYLFTACILWAALWYSGTISFAALCASVVAALLLLWLYFVVGFRSFASGSQANGLGSFLTLGLPLLLFASLRFDLIGPAILLPPGTVYLPLAREMSVWWAIGPLFAAALAYRIGTQALRRCEADLRSWYDQNQGKKSLD